MTAEIDAAAVAAIAKGLTRTQREAVLAFSSDWLAGPYLGDETLPELRPLREARLIEREFGDMGPSRTTTDSMAMQISVSACWWFRLTPLGLAVRAHLTEGARRG